MQAATAHQEDEAKVLMRKLKWPISLTLAGLFIYWFLSKLDLSQVWAEARHVRFSYLCLALALLLGTYVVRSLRWRRLLRPMAAPSLRGLLRATMVGFAALFLVGRAGEMIVRPMALSAREPVEPSASYASVMIERVFDMVMVDLVFAVNLVFFEFSAPDAESVRQFGLIRTAGFFLLAVAIAGIYGLSVFRNRRQGVLDFLDRKLRFLPRPIFNSVISLLRQVSEGLAVLHDAGSLAVTVSYTALLWLMVICAYVLVLRAFGITASDISVTGTVFVMGLSMIGSIVPTPGGSTGPFHAVTAAALVFLGVERNKAASAAIVLHLLIFLPAVFFGLFFLIKDGLSISSLMRRAPKAEADPIPVEASPRADAIAISGPANWPSPKSGLAITEDVRLRFKKKAATGEVLQGRPREEEPL